MKKAIDYVIAAAVGPVIGWSIGEMYNSNMGALGFWVAISWVATFIALGVKADSTD